MITMNTSNSNPPPNMTLREFLTSTPQDCQHHSLKKFAVIIAPISGLILATVLFILFRSAVLAISLGTLQAFALVLLALVAYRYSGGPLDED